ncbi:hypothetical protein [Pantoea vagans]|uniref:hypothetical protein n=1 Tax=Pantoea vagans TaxID=470934 RepID=UPI00067FF79D|nr:hypothetical protein [Pantoea vagans]KNH33576.1 hypothetical protein ACS76_06025 [Pantoea vagans]
MKEDITEKKESIGKVLLKKGIEGFEIECHVNISLSEDKKKNINEIKTKKMSTSKYILCCSPFFIATIVFFISDLNFDSSFHLTLFSLPVIIGLGVYFFCAKSPANDLKKTKLTVDAITLISSTITACILIFKTIHVDNPYIELFINLPKELPLFYFGLIIKTAIYLIMYMIIFIFATSATVKCCIALKDHSAKKN